MFLSSFKGHSAVSIIVVVGFIVTSVIPESVIELEVPEIFGKDDLLRLVQQLERDALTNVQQDDEVNFTAVNRVSGVIVDNGTITDTETATIGSKEGNDQEHKDDKGLYDEDDDDYVLDDSKGPEIIDDDQIQGREGDDDDEFLPRDLNDLQAYISDDITAGVEESLKIFGDVKDGNHTAESPETRQMPMYMFQGQYIAEPRLNRFIDGALRNMGTEMRISSMDPIYFRVLPKGRVEHRQPGTNIKLGNGTRRPIRGKRSLTLKNNGSYNSTELVPEDVEGRGLIFGRRRAQLLKRKRQQKAKILAQRRRRRRQQQLQNKRRNKGFKAVGNKKKTAAQIRLQRLKQQQKKKRIQQQRLQNKRQQQNLKRLRRQSKNRNVGGGRVEGLSKITRDGDAEMQLFGNYTLIRSHMKMGPVELTMQFRTRKGIRRTGATLPQMRAHMVTRVNHEGSEMVDFLLDRPHPESIRVRGNLFPLAKQIARNTFARLFLPDSFLVQRMRQKTALALLSKPSVAVH